MPIQHDSTMNTSAEQVSDETYFIEQLLEQKAQYVAIPTILRLRFLVWMSVALGWLLCGGRYGVARGMVARPILIRRSGIEPRVRPRVPAHKGLCYGGNWHVQSGGSSSIYMSTSSVPERPQLLVKSTRVKSVAKSCTTCPSPAATLKAWAEVTKSRGTNHHRILTDRQAIVFWAFPLLVVRPLSVARDFQDHRKIDPILAWGWVATGPYTVEARIERTSVGTVVHS